MLLVTGGAGFIGANFVLSTIRDTGETIVNLDKDGEMQQPVRSSVGLALTRSLLAVNTCSLSIGAVAGAGILFSLSIPAALIGAPPRTG